MPSTDEVSIPQAPNSLDPAEIFAQIPHAQASKTIKTLSGWALRLVKAFLASCDL